MKVWWTYIQYQIDKKKTHVAPCANYIYLLSKAVMKHTTFICMYVTLTYINISMYYMSVSNSYLNDTLSSWRKEENDNSSKSCLLCIWQCIRNFITSFNLLLTYRTMVLYVIPSNFSWGNSEGLINWPKSHCY